ncbi:hypothetical protein AMECASPLE_033324 [Ameca splendens]|uniref:Uncharacterized protein n=1 Tax=Ameca splendens TaxID=208324 RepID=A0ABV0XVX0_9TELE
MFDNTNSSEKSDISLDIFQTLSERDAADSGEESQLLSDGRAQELRRANSHLIRPESILAGCQSMAGVNKHESSCTTRKQNGHNIWIFKKFTEDSLDLAILTNTHIYLYIHMHKLAVVYIRSATGFTKVL